MPPRDLYRAEADLLPQPVVLVPADSEQVMDVAVLVPGQVRPVEDVEEQVLRQAALRDRALRALAEHAVLVLGERVTLRRDEDAWLPSLRGEGRIVFEGTVRDLD